MKNKILLITGKVLNVLIVIGTIMFVIINFENITYGSRNGLITRPSKSLNVRYHYWIKDKYGEDEGFEICRRIEKQTVSMIEHHTNEKIFAVIVLMMISSIWINKKLNKKMNKAFKVYFIICILMMLWTTFVAGPDYVDSIFDS